MSVNLKIIAILVAFLFLPMPFLKCEAAGVKMGYGWSVNPDEAEAVKEAMIMMQKQSVTMPTVSSVS